MTKRSLSRQSQGVRQYLSLKKDLDNESDEIPLSLSRFIRIMFFDAPNSWIKEINRFDFVRLASLHPHFGNINSFVSESIGYCISISPENQKRHKELEIDDFFQANILEIEGKTYSLIDFIWSICYNGSLHMIPDRKYDKYELIYTSFLEPYPDQAYELMFEIARVLIDIFDEFYEILLGSNNAISPNRNFQPMIIRNGVLLDGTYFNNSFLQMPLRHKKNKGVRICLDIKLDETKDNNVIFECGHRDSNSLRIKLSQSNSLLLLLIMSEGKRKTMKADISNLIGNYFNIEIAVYPNGKSVLAINQILKDSIDIEKQIEINDGKLIIGSNLEASTFGEFYNNTLVVQSIDSSNSLRNLNVFGKQKLNLQTSNVSYNELKRPFL